jgi:hypothetical protein
LAFFHFDAAVNQGVAGATRMLQQSVGADSDGEIGPLTLAAIAAQPVALTLAAYADIRRQHYRSLSQFWRFGNGWLRRVDRTLELAQAIERQQQSARPDVATITPSQQQEKSAMSTQPEQTGTGTASPATADSKWWGQSMTIWGVVITFLSTADHGSAAGPQRCRSGAPDRRPGRPVDRRLGWHNFDHLWPHARHNAPGTAANNPQRVKPAGLLAEPTGRPV